MLEQRGRQRVVGDEGGGVECDSGKCRWWKNSGDAHMHAHTHTHTHTHTPLEWFCFHSNTQFHHAQLTLLISSSERSSLAKLGFGALG